VGGAGGSSTTVVMWGTDLLWLLARLSQRRCGVAMLVLLPSSVAVKSVLCDHFWL
jgi:hypothetical protein